ncbi:zinc finger protein [Trichonephila clavata]|uniref:Zinc finger protein n=2 Tax=Trichonephila clavata TaxID=2740835 RepID=A0A8X6HWI3_TRICU|nr:zinc finger protein [Trichonephila clavata]
MHAPSFQSQMAGRFLKVTVADAEQYRELNSFLTEAGVEFKSFNLKEDRPVKVVIRGLPSNTEPEDIQAEIEAEAKVVREGLELGRKLVTYFQQNDPHVDRALRLQRNITESLNEYEEVYNVLSKNKSQSLIKNFISMSRRNEINPNMSTTETASNEIILSSDESEINKLRKASLNEA